MKKTIWIAASLLATSFSANAASPTQAMLDTVTLAYLNNKVFAQGAVDCRGAEVGTRPVIGCRNKTLNGTSLTQLWLVDLTTGTPRYLALNGTARTTYTRHFRSNRSFAEAAIPLPPDFAIDDALKRFN